MPSTNDLLRAFQVFTGIALLAAVYAMNGGTTTMAYGVSTDKTAMVIAYDWPRISMKIVPVGDDSKMANSRMNEPDKYPALVFNSETWMDWSTNSLQTTPDNAKQASMTAFCTDEKTVNTAFSGFMPNCGPVSVTKPMTRMESGSVTAGVLPSEWEVASAQYTNIKAAGTTTLKQSKHCQKMVKMLSSTGFTFGTYVTIVILLCVEIIVMMSPITSVNGKKFHAVFILLGLFTLCVLGSVHARYEHYATTPDSGWMKNQSETATTSVGYLVTDNDSHCFGDVFVRTMAAAYPDANGTLGKSKLQYLGHFPEQMDWDANRNANDNQFNQFKSSFVQGKVTAHAVAAGFAGWAVVWGLITFFYNWYVNKNANENDQDPFGFDGMWGYKTTASFAL